MSPVLAVLYFLLASSPVWRHEESPMTSTSSSWESRRFPSTFDLESSSIFGGEHKNIFESLFNNKDNKWNSCEESCETAEPMTRLFRALRKAIRPTTSSRRHFATELFGDFETSPMTSEFESIESPMKLVKLIKRIAKVHPALIEKLLTRPELILTVVEKVIRRNPELILTIAKIARRNPEVARLVKKLIKKSIFSNTKNFDFETESSTTPFSALFSKKNFEREEESPIMTRRFVEKMIRNPIVLSKVIRRLVKNSNKFETECPVAELLSTLSHVEPKKIEKVIRRLVKSVKSTKNVFEPEFETLSTSSWEKKSPMKKLVKKIVKAIVKSEKKTTKNVFGAEEKEILCNACESVCERESFEFSPISAKNNNKWTKKVCRVCDNVCRHSMTSSVFGRHFDF